VRWPYTGIAILQSFANRIDQDYAAVRAALETQWSNGQTEGQWTDRGASKPAQTIETADVRQSQL
jgi:hypothetical protein